MEKLTVQSTIIPLSKIEMNRGQIEGLPKNPRIFKKDKLEKLKRSIQEDPDMLKYRELLVFPHGEKFVIIGGNMRYKALKELGVDEVPCKIIEPSTDVNTLKAYVVKDNSSFGDWDSEVLLEGWNDSQLADWCVDVPEFEAFSEEEEIERKKREFEEKMASGAIGEDDPEYQEFVQKFEPKKTTDDCYTPDVVYDAVAEWVANEYGVSRSKFVRPFYPGGDYQKEKYNAGDIVVDNPPFSIIAQILRYYNEKGIRFFLFGPHLTLFSSSSALATAIVVGCAITYKNGASVNTSFLTNLGDSSIRFKSSPSLYRAVEEANNENLRSLRKEFPKYKYDKHIITTPLLEQFSRLGIEFSCPVCESEKIRCMDAQKESGKAIFGSGYIVSDRVYAEREKAEREKAEREKAEREKAEREKAEREKAEREKAESWELSPREMKIIERLNKKGGTK